MKKERLGLFIFSVFIVLLSILSFVSGSQLKVTEEHPFLINGSWISASQLQVGDLLTTVDGKNVRITSIEDVVEETNFSVYNLESKEYSDFVVDGGDNLSVVVHNSDKNSIVVSLMGKAYRDALGVGRIGAIKTIISDSIVIERLPRSNEFALHVFPPKLPAKATREELVSFYNDYATSFRDFVLKNPDVKYVGTTPTGSLTRTFIKRVKPDLEAAGFKVSVEESPYNTNALQKMNYKLFSKLDPRFEENPTTLYKIVIQGPNYSPSAGQFDPRGYKLFKLTSAFATGVGIVVVGSGDLVLYREVGKIYIDYSRKKDSLQKQ